MRSSKLTDNHLRQRALVYVRQSTPNQVQGNLESQRRQYSLADMARELGFEDVVVIDEDLGRSGSGKVDRPGFDRLFSELTSRKVGAVFCLEASRLARNGREWHTLLDLCAVVDAVLVDPDGVYDPNNSNDRLLLGMKGTLSEYELTLLRQRALSAVREKAARGELRFVLPVGLCWTQDGRIELNPDLRIQEAVRLVYRKYAELGSMRQVLLWFHQEKLSMPRHQLIGSEFRVEWAVPVASTIHRTLTSPFYAGAYAWGRTSSKVGADGASARPWHEKLLEEWEVLIVDHHEGYIGWSEYLRIRETMAENAHGNPWTGRKAGRGGQGLLAGLLRCRRCGRRLTVSYTGEGNPRYHCPGTSRQNGVHCIAFGGVHVDKAISEELMAVVEQPAIEAAMMAAENISRQRDDALRTLELELEQAQYRARLAERRYENVDPDNRLVAPQLERRWNDALAEVAAVEKRLENQKRVVANPPAIDREHLLRLAKALPEVWDDPETDMRAKQRIARVLIEEIMVDIDEDKGQVLLLVHWAGGRHSEVCAKRRRQGEHRLTTSVDTIEIVRQMGMYCSDRQIAATLNRLKISTAKGLSWTAARVRGLRYTHGLTDAVLAEQAIAEPCVTLVETAKRLATSTTTIRRLITEGVLPAEQIVPSAPWRIPAAALTDPNVAQAVASTGTGRRPRTRSVAGQNPLFPTQ
jgi:DNA invertase Pin-like site-specific DNA recombinase